MYKYQLCFPLNYSNSGYTKVSVIKALRELTGMSLKMAKDMSESSDAVVETNRVMTYLEQDTFTQCKVIVTRLDDVRAQDEVETEVTPELSTIHAKLKEAAKLALELDDVKLALSILKLIK